MHNLNTNDLTGTSHAYYSWYEHCMTKVAVKFNLYRDTKMSCFRLLCLFVWHPLPSQGTCPLFSPHLGLALGCIGNLRNWCNNHFNKHKIATMEEVTTSMERGKRCIRARSQLDGRRTTVERIGCAAGCSFNAIITKDKINWYLRTLKSCTHWYSACPPKILGWGSR